MISGSRGENEHTTRKIVSSSAQHAYRFVHVLFSPLFSVCTSVFSARQQLRILFGYPHYPGTCACTNGYPATGTGN